MLPGKGAKPMIEQLNIRKENDMLNLCLAFLRSKELINLEISIMNHRYKGDDIQEGCISSAGALAAFYTQENIPTTETLYDEIKKHRNALCVASIDTEDDDRIAVAVILDARFPGISVNYFESRVEDKKRILSKLIAKVTAEN